MVTVKAKSQLVQARVMRNNNFNNTLKRGNSLIIPKSSSNLNDIFKTTQGNTQNRYPLITAYIKKIFNVK